MSGKVALIIREDPELEIREVRKSREHQNQIIYEGRRQLSS